MRRIFIVAFAASLFAASAFTQKAAQANGIVATWPVGHQPFGIAVDPSDGRVFVANSGATTNPTVSVVDPGTGSVTSLATSGTSNLVAVDSAARRLYSSNANGTLDVFDLTNGTRIATAPVGGLGVAVDPTARRVYVAGGTGPFAVVDGITNSVVATRSVPSGQLWFAVALDPGMHRVYVSNVDQTRPTLEVLDDRDLSLVSEVAIPKPIRWGLAVDAARHYVYLNGSDPAGPPFANSAFYVLDPSSLAVIQTTALSGYVFGIALAPETHRIYRTEASGNRLYELDDAPLPRGSTTPVPWRP